MKIDKELIAKVLGSQRSLKYNKKHFEGYSRIIDLKDFSIYERAIKADKIVAAYGDIIIKQRGATALIYIPDARVPFLNYCIKLNNRMFPGLYEKSKISQCMLIPYLRVVKKDSYIRDVRLCVITDKGQIFHNKPSRDIEFDGLSLKNDVVHFEESVIWDIPGRKYPSKNKKHDECECYYPGLPEHCYEYTPMINDNSSFVDKYHNGGFPKSIVIESSQNKICSRFYRYSTNERANPFMFIGTGNRNDKMCLIGTYRPNVDCGVRICLFASSDGGREWFCKYEFSDTGEYEFRQGYSDSWGTNFGNRISINVDWKSNNGGITIYKRILNLPKVDDGKIETDFTWEKKALVKRIYGNNKTLVYTDSAHGLENGNIIAFKASEDLPEKLEWLKCKDLNSKGSIGGMQFKVLKIDDYCFELYELVSSQTPTLPCRHIHHINLQKDGWIVGTGEIYPNGWLLYVQQKMADTFSIVNAKDDLTMVRITTKRDSVQRTMGMILKDKKMNNVVFASDHDTLERNNICSNSFKGVSRGSTGVYMGNLEDLDDRNKFECIFEAIEPCYYFQKIQDMLIFAGQRGELAICTDSQMNNWIELRLGRFIMHYMGYYYNYHIFNDYIILRK